LENFFYILALEIAIPGNEQCVNCIGTLALPTSSLQTDGGEMLYAKCHRT